MARLHLAATVREDLRELELDARPIFGVDALEPADTLQFSEGRNR